MDVINKIVNRLLKNNNKVVSNTDYQSISNEELSSELVNRISSSDYMVIFLSSNYSKWQEYETYIGLEKYLSKRDITIIPVLLDKVAPNRNFENTCIWGQLFNELKARMILVEFKNYDKTEIGKDEVNQIRNYLTESMGKLAILVCSKLPNEAAHIKRNSIFSEDGKIILFITKKELEEMIYIKERGEEPEDLIMDLIKCFYLQHE